MALQLHAKDRKILAELDMGARQPLSVLAKKVGLSRELVNYRIRQLEKKGVIQGYYAVVDTAKLGLFYCRIVYKYRQMSYSREKELLDYCYGNEHITWIVLGEGRADIALIVICSTLDVLESVYDKLNTKFGVNLQSPYLSIAFRIHHLNHRYLHGKQELQECVLGERHSPSVRIDKVDGELMRLLSDNARCSLVELAEKLSTTPKLVSYRIKKLLASRIILAFRAKINTRLLGYDHYKVFLVLQSLDNNSQNRILNYLKAAPNVIYVTKPMGVHTLEFEIMVRNMAELHEFVRKLKAEFANLVTDCETNFCYDEPIIRYFPSFRYR